MKLEYNLENTFEMLLKLAKNNFGITEYIYTKRKHTYHSRTKSHTFSLTDKDNIITSKEYFENIKKGNSNQSQAFFGKMRGDYYTYHQKVLKKGYLYILKDMIESEIQKEKNVQE